MMVSGAEPDFAADFEDRAEAVRRALGGLAGAKKANFGFQGSSGYKPPAPLVSSPASKPATQTAVPRIPLQDKSQIPALRMQSKDMAAKVPAQNSKEDSYRAMLGEFTPKGTLQDETMLPNNLRTPKSQPAFSKPAGAPVVQDAQNLLCQLRLTEKQPLRGFTSDGAGLQDAAQLAKPQGQPRRIRSELGRNGKKKTEIEKENDRLLDELEALGEPAIENLGETPVDMNARLRREATTAMLKHSFFVKKRPTPPASSASTASGDYSNRS